MNPKPNKVKLKNQNILEKLGTDYDSAWNQRDIDECFRIIEKVVKISPNSVNALLMMGRLHGVVYNYDQAVACFDRAVKKAPREIAPTILRNAATASKDFFDLQISETLLRRSIELSKGPEGKIELAVLLIRSRREEAAEDLIGEVLELEPQNAKAILLWCSINKKHPDCESKLVELTKSHDMEITVRAGYQLASLRDAGGDYQGAMKTLLTVKERLASFRATIVNHRKRFHDRIQQFADAISEPVVSKWREEVLGKTDPRKIVLLAGHPRSGTTLLEQVLDSHSEIASAEETEDFDIWAYTPAVRKARPGAAVYDVLMCVDQDEVVKSRSRYFQSLERCLGSSLESKMLIDKNPSLTPLAGAFLRFFPEARIISLYRDPRDVILSCFMQPFFPLNGITGNYLKMDDAVAEYLAVMSAWQRSSKSFSDQIHHVRYEDMTEDLRSVAERTLNFLDVKWEDDVLSFDRHAAEKVVRSPTSNAVTEKVHRRATFRWKNYREYIEPYQDRLRPLVRELGYEDA